MDKGCETSGPSLWLDTKRTSGATRRMRIHCSTPPSSGLFDRFPHDFLIRFALRPLRASLRRGQRHPGLLCTRHGTNGTRVGLVRHTHSAGRALTRLLTRRNSKVVCRVVPVFQKRREALRGLMTGYEHRTQEWLECRSFLSCSLGM
jgi:hypothetical protein